MNAVVSFILLKNQFAGNVFLWMHIASQGLGRAKPVPLHKVDGWALQASKCQLGLAEDEGSHRASAGTHLLLEMSKLLVM